MGLKRYGGEMWTGLNWLRTVSRWASDMRNSLHIKNDGHPITSTAFLEGMTKYFD